MKKTIRRTIKNNHFLMMIICCAVPLGFISLLAFSGIFGSWGYYAIFLLCPLLHVFMMRGHSSSHGNDNVHARIGEKTVTDPLQEK
ncbi:DUF2933 domain-containing protein [Thermodesulfobacteriota bacterium]